MQFCYIHISVNWHLVFLGDEVYPERIECHCIINVILLFLVYLSAKTTNILYGFISQLKELCAGLFPN